MAVRKEAEQQELERIALPDDRLLDLIDHRARDPADLGEVHQMASKSVTSSRRSCSGMPGAKRSLGSGRSGRSSSHQRPSVSGPGRRPRRSSACRRDLAEVRQQACVQVVGVADCERHLALHLGELRYRGGRLWSRVERRSEVRPSCARCGGGDRGDDDEHQERPEEQQVDVHGDAALARQLERHVEAARRRTG